MSTAMPDRKRYIDERTNGDFARRMSDLFDVGRVPPFAMVFPESQEGSPTTEEKDGKQFVQFGFVLTDAAGRVLPYTRVRNRPVQFGVGENLDRLWPGAGRPLVPHGAGHAHSVSDGRSVLVGWSPVGLLNGRTFPQSEDDVRFALRQEVPDPPAGQPLPRLTFLGLARRTKALRGYGSARYWFYLFECQYDSGSGPVGARLLKDTCDQLDPAFVPADAALLRSMGKNHVDLQAMRLACNCDLSGSDVGDVEVVSPTRAADPPPFMVRSPGVFFCHSHQDKAFVHELAGRLEAAGLPTWVDKDQLHPGNVWFTQASEAVRYCQVFLIVVSAHSNGSEACLRELTEAYRRRDWLRAHNPQVPYQMIPVVLDGQSMAASLPSGLASIHTVDCRDPAARGASIDALVAFLRASVTTVEPIEPRGVARADQRAG